MRRVALIPARGGSKRLPRKNIADFLGRPIIAYTIDAALRCGLFPRVVVSTEDPEIAAIARAAGADLADRPPALAGDRARLLDVCLQFLDEESAGGREWDVLACLLPTAPMRGAKDLEAVARLVEPGRCDFAMAVTTYPLPPLQALRRDAGGFLSPMWPEYVNLRSQDAPALVVDNGSTYVVSVPAFRAERTFYGSTLRGHDMPRERSVDIDEPVDLAIARALASGVAA